MRAGARGDRRAGENLGYTIDAIVEDDHDSTLRVITGTYGVPVFLSGGEENYDSYGALVRGTDGLPVAQRTMQANFTMVIPKIAEDAARRPMPLLQYGHGLMGSSEESKAGWLRDLANTYGYVVVAHDWMGVAEPDVPAVVRALGNANDSEILFDRTKQGTVNAIALTRVARWQLSQDEAASVDGEPVIDTSQVYYYGNSQGGIWGTTLCAYSPELQKCVLGVGAANYSTMLQRSVDWPGYGIVQYGAYPERMTDLILITLMQMMWDPTDAVTASSHLMSDPFPDTPLRPVLMQCGIADSQVPNVATDYQARTMGIPYLAPAVRDIYGVTPREGPLDSALTYWDYGLDPIKTNNVMGDDNEVHEAVRRSPAAQRQLAMFLTPGGQVEQTCTGADGGCWCERRRLRRGLRVALWRAITLCDRITQGSTRKFLDVAHCTDRFRRLSYSAASPTRRCPTSRATIRPASRRPSATACCRGSAGRAARRRGGGPAGRTRPHPSRDRSDPRARYRRRR